MSSSANTSKDFRKNTFKNRGLSGSELRRRHKEESVVLRKQKREEALYKRRSAPIVDAASESDAEEDVEFNAASAPESLNARLASYSQGIYSSDLAQILENAKAFRKALSKGTTPPVAEVIDCGVVPRLVELLTFFPQQSVTDDVARVIEDIQFEACWALTNVTFGTSEQTMVVVNSGAVPSLIHLMNHPKNRIKEQAVWTLGNIAGDGPYCRDMLLGMDFLAILCAFINSILHAANKDLGILRNASWCLSNLCRGKPSPSWEILCNALPTLMNLINFGDDQVIADASWGIAYLSDAGNDALNGILATGFVPHLVRLMGSANSDVQCPALRGIGNIVTGNNEQTQAVIDAGAIPAIKSLLTAVRQSLQREACWTVSNIAAGTDAQVQALVECDVFTHVVYLLHHGDFRTRKEACWAVSNATSHRRTHPDHVRYLVSVGAVKALCDFLNGTDAKILLVALDAINNILEVGESDALHHDSVNHYAMLVEENNGLTKISQLQEHHSEDVYLKCKAIIDRFFADEDAVEIDDEATFSFDASARGDSGTKYTF